MAIMPNGGNEMDELLKQQLQSATKTLDSYEKAILSPKEGADLEFIKKSIEHYRGEVTTIRAQLVATSESK